MIERLEEIKSRIGVCLVPTPEAIERGTIMTCHEFDICNCDVKWLVAALEKCISQKEEWARCLEVAHGNPYHEILNREEKELENLI